MSKSNHITPDQAVGQGFSLAADAISPHNQNHIHKETTKSSPPTSQHASRQPPHYHNYHHEQHYLSPQTRPPIANSYHHSPLHPNRLYFAKLPPNAPPNSIPLAQQYPGGSNEDDFRAAELHCERLSSRGHNCHHNNIQTQHQTRTPEDDTPLGSPQQNLISRNHSTYSPQATDNRDTSPTRKGSTPSKHRRKRHHRSRSPSPT